MSGQRVDFTSFVASIGAGAAAALQQVEELRRGGGEAAGEGGSDPPTAQQVQEQVQSTLAAARQLIDTLALLEEKTEGNLTDAEREALRNTLSHLRVAYVKSATPGN